MSAINRLAYVTHRTVTVYTLSGDLPEPRKLTQTAALLVLVCARVSISLLLYIKAVLWNQNVLLNRSALWGGAVLVWVCPNVTSQRTCDGGSPRPYKMVLVCQYHAPICALFKLLTNGWVRQQPFYLDKT